MENKTFNYGPQKQYYQKEEFMKEVQTKYFNFVRKHLKKKYIITPQVSLKSLIEIRPDYLRQDELARNVDFGIFSHKKYKPLLLIDFGGNKKETTFLQEKDINTILNDVEMPILNYDVEDVLNQMGEVTNKKLLKDIYETIKNDQLKKHITKKTEFLFKGLDIRNGKLFITLSTYNFNWFSKTLKINNFTIEKSSQKVCKTMSAVSGFDKNGASIGKKHNLILKPFSKGMIELEFENFPVANGNKIYYEGVVIALVHDI